MSPAIALGALLEFLRLSGRSFGLSGTCARAFNLHSDTLLFARETLPLYCLTTTSGSIGSLEVCIATGWLQSGLCPSRIGAGLLGFACSSPWTLVRTGASLVGFPPLGHAARVLKTGGGLLGSSFALSTSSWLLTPGVVKELKGKERLLMALRRIAKLHPFLADLVDAMARFFTKLPSALVGAAGFFLEYLTRLPKLLKM